MHLRYGRMRPVVTGCVAWFFLAISAVAQNIVQAQMTGGGGAGKCTFEVRVCRRPDPRQSRASANQNRNARTMGFRGSGWLHFRRTPNNFRFAGVDGRGRQYLLRSPNQNNGVAVIRIEDTRNGYEGYTGDIMWNGGNNSGGTWPGWWNDNWNGGGGWNPTPAPAPGWSNNIVPNCQNNIRNKVRQQIKNAQVNFNGQPRPNQAGSFVMVDGTANVRDNQGRYGQISYHCTMHPNGNVAESSYNVTQPPTGPQPR